MQIDFELIRGILEHRLRQSDVERLLEGLSEEERAQLFFRISELVRRTSALADVANRVSDSLSLDVLFPTLMDVVSETLGAERSSLFLHDPETGELFSRVLQGDAMGEIRFPPGMGIAGTVFATGVAEIIADAYADPRFNQEVDRRSGFRTRNILCVPIRNKQGDLIGITQALNKREGEFDSEDQHLLEGLSRQAAAALENAQLYERVERQRREEGLLLEVVSSIVTEIQLDPLLVKIVNAAARLLEADRGTLFLHDAANHQLYSRISEGLDVAELRFPEDAGIAGDCFVSGAVINLPDAYADPRFNRDFDQRTGYRTRNLLCMPIVARGNRTLGVMEILNRKGGPFTAADERRLRAFCAQAAISLENAQLFREVSEQRNYNESILRSLSAGILTLDADGVVRKSNGAAQRILRRSEAELAGCEAAMLFRERNDWVLQSLAAVRRMGRPDFTLDAELGIEEGVAISVNLTAAPLAGANAPPGSLLVLEDISREKRLRSTMSRYVSKAVVDRLLEEGEAALVGTGREASVLFSDIRGFSGLAERLGARETVALLNDYFTGMVDVVFAQGGILDKYVGDMIMAVYGSVESEADDPVRAVATATQMMSTLATLNAAWRQAGRETLRIGVGIATGHVIAGNIGSPRRLEYTVIGDSVNLAQRLESANKFYGSAVLLCQATRDRLDDQRHLRLLDVVRVRGIHRPVAVHESLAHLPEADRARLDKVFAAYADGLAAYRERDWARASAGFAEVLDIRPQDGPAAVMRSRCEALAVAPPPASWDGVWDMPL